MIRLLEAVADVVSNTPPEKVEQLAQLAARLASPAEVKRLSQWAIAPESKKRLERLIQAWERESSISGAELSAMIKAASYVQIKVSGEQIIELVWTGPSSHLVPTRKTERALIQVIQHAQERLFLTSFVAYKVDEIIESLKLAIERGVKVSILLERSESDGGAVSNDGISAMKKTLPEASVFAWDSKAESFMGGKVHAKVAVADEKVCFISSANLTGHAMEKNMEAGVLIEGGTVPEKLHRHLEALITTKQLTRA